MSKRGPILIIEDDEDDKNILELIVKELGYFNPIVWFDTTDNALDYLCTTHQAPFIIFSDINLPGRNGLEFKTKIDSDPVLRKKSIPFIFYSTSGHQRDVNEAYTKMTIQGFFKKGNDFESAKKTIGLILAYWSECLHPNIQ